MSELYSATQVSNLITTLANQVKAVIAPYPVEDTAIIGIHKGGQFIADIIHQQCQIQHPIGTLDTGLYRDDFAQNGLHSQDIPSNIPFEVENKVIILVDDIIFTGRTIRAAINEIFDYGRPKRIILVCLADRGNREIPIQPDIVALQMTLDPEQQIKLDQNGALQLQLKTP